MSVLVLQRSLKLISISTPMFSQLFPLWCVPATLAAFILSKPRVWSELRQPEVMDHRPASGLQLVCPLRGKLLINESLQLVCAMLAVKQ